MTLDLDLAELYKVKPIALRQQVKRNQLRFPEYFMFQLTAEEASALVSQFVIPKRRSYGGSLPYAFTEQGVAMLATVLRSQRAIQVSVAIVRVFVKLRQILAEHQDFAHRLDELERKFDHHDAQLHAVFEAIRELTPLEPVPAKRRIGFKMDDSRPKAAAQITARSQPRRRSHRS